EAELDAEEAEAHVPDLPERQVRFVGHVAVVPFPDAAVGVDVVATHRLLPVIPARGPSDFRRIDDNFPGRWQWRRPWISACAGVAPERGASRQGASSTPTISITPTFASLSAPSAPPAPPVYRAKCRRSLMLNPSPSVKTQACPAAASNVAEVERCSPTLCGITIGNSCPGASPQRTASRFTAAVTPVLIGPFGLS